MPFIPFWLTALVLVSLQLTVAVYGYNMIHFLERILAVVLFFGFLLITIVSLSRGWSGSFPAFRHCGYPSVVPPESSSSA